MVINVVSEETSDCGSRTSCMEMTELFYYKATLKLPYSKKCSHLHTVSSTTTIRLLFSHDFFIS